MPLQTDRLVMIGLGVLNDIPPVSLQPPLSNGIHLRWSFQREVGFPWHGYYLFHRPQFELISHRCVSESWKNLSPATLSRVWSIPEGVFHSNDNLVLTPDPAQNDRVGLDLSPIGDRNYLQFDTHENDFAFRVFVNVKFRELPSQTREGRGVTVTALDGGMAVGSEFLTYASGQTATANFWFDRITSVHITAGDGALTELCVYPVLMGHFTGGLWSPVPMVQPITLPISHPDYPARLGAINLDAAWGEAQQRIRYGPPETWAGEPFNSLHEQLKALLVGGPPGPVELAMAHPSRAHKKLVGKETPSISDDLPPTIPEAHPLDLVSLGAIHPAIAQMLGLYGIDTTPSASNPNISYDYMVVADHAGVAEGSLGKMLSIINLNQSPFEDIDAWITFGKRMKSSQGIDPPQGVRAYALPGGTFRESDGKVRDAQGNVGIAWPVKRAALGYLSPGHPVMYHVWRDHQGGGSTPVPNPEALDLVTTGRPLLLVNLSEVANEPVQYPADWPPFSLRCIDFALSEGWYGYQVNAIDLFGRFSRKSAFAEWWQWAPPPQPTPWFKPWYYIDPPGERVVHPASVRVLDKLSPPPPLAVEAYALDPDDPLLVKDEAYKDWIATLEPVGDPPIGLRVRWWWTALQQRQAPDTVEFRIYWHRGSATPAGWRDVAVWQLRCYVCFYEQDVKVLAKDEIATLEQNGEPVPTVIHRQGDRRYEIFLPITGIVGPFTNGVPLEPTLIDPVVYANVTVTAADATAHSPDQWLGAGPFAARTGKESQPAAPQRVYRVWRQRPDPPQVLHQPARQYATPADYHNRSYFTYRWQPAANLWAHVYRALDDSLFIVDWAMRGQRGAIDSNNPEHQKYFPQDWGISRRQEAATALNTLNSQNSYRNLPDDALRILAGLPGNEKAFSQLTTTSLDSSVNSLRDSLDGRATNCYFYRASYVDKAQNLSQLSLANAPVFLPDVTPPRAPALNKVLGAEQKIVVRWTSNREPDLAEYRVYRIEGEATLNDSRLMSLVHTLQVDGADPASRPAEMVWEDAPPKTRIIYSYCVVTVDTAGNASEPSKLQGNQATDSRVPVLTTDRLETAWDAAQNGVRVTWPSADAELVCEARRDPAWARTAVKRLQYVAAQPRYQLLDDEVDEFETYRYQVTVKTVSGQEAGTKVRGAYIPL